MKSATAQQIPNTQPPIYLSIDTNSLAAVFENGAANQGITIEAHTKIGRTHQFTIAARGTTEEGVATYLQNLGAQVEIEPDTRCPNITATMP